MLYTLRYEEELRDAKSALSGVKDSPVASDELDLAKQLIAKSTSKFDLSSYKDDYEEAVKKLVDAKRKGKKLPEEEAPAPATKVVNIMDALRNSLANEKKSSRTKTKTPKRKKAA